MRAPADSTKPTTGAPARSARRSTRDDRVGVLLAERAAEVGRVLGVAEDRAAVDAPGAGEHAVAGARLLAHAARARRRCAAAAASRGRRAPRGARADVQLVVGVAARDRSMRHGGLQAQHGVVAAEAERVRQRHGRVAVDVERPRPVRHVVEVELVVGLLVVEGRRGDAVAQGEDRRHRLDGAGRAEQVADRATSARRRARGRRRGPP